mmetsp:Transcript_35721/g.93452  ORF Transcript_35721/g.93452 Transcript_35721/m.93452 type:complete len:861 (+) Transcript_35721:72-2654(+)
MSARDGRVPLLSPSISTQSQGGYGAIDPNMIKKGVVLDAGEQDQDRAREILYFHRSTFAVDMEVALRGALASCLVIGFSMSPLVHMLPLAYQSREVLCMIGFWLIMTIWKDFGNTLRNAVHGVSGCLLAVINSLAMNSIYPGGAHGAPGNHYNELVVYLDLAIFVLIILGLSFPERTRVFALFYFAMFMMFFMNPESTAAFSRVAVFNVEGTGVVFLAMCVTGTLLALLSVAMPPLTCRDRALERAKGLTEAMICITCSVLEYYCGTQRSIVASKWQSELEMLVGQVYDWESDIAQSWWEGFDIGPLGESSMLHQSYAALIRKCLDTVHGMEVSASREDFDDSHQQTVGALKDSMRAALSSTNRMLNAILRAVEDGIITEQEDKLLQEHAANVHEAVEKMCTEYKVSKSELGFSSLKIDLLEEDFFIFCMATYATHVCDFAKRQHVPQSGHFLVGFRDRLLPCFFVDISREHVNFIIRGSLAFAFAFFVAVQTGYILKAYHFNYLLPGTVALILSRHSGSALLKNLGRMQAVVLGLVLPLVVIGVLPVCAPAGKIILFALAFCFFAACLYVHLAAGQSGPNHVQYGFLAMLMAAFGATAFFQPCLGSQVSGNAQGIAVFMRIMVTVSAIFLVFSIDFALAYERPSAATHEALVGCMKGIKSRLVNALRGKPVDEEVEYHMLMEQLHLATDSCQEASLEPRYWRSPFNADLVHAMIEWCHKVRLDVRAVEDALSTNNGVEDGATMNMVMCLNTHEEYRNMVEAIEDIFDATINLVSEVVQHESTEPNKGHERFAPRDPGMTCLQELIAALNDSSHFHTIISADEQALVNKALSGKMCVILLMLQSIADNLLQVAQTALSAV